MIVAVTGGRTYHLTPQDYGWLDGLHTHLPIATLFEGGATGVDTAVRSWAQRQGIPCVTYWANWEKEGKAAGPRRNRRMLDALIQEAQAGNDPYALLAFPGTVGTTNCIQYARRVGVPILPSPTAPWLRETVRSSDTQEALWSS